MVSSNLRQILDAGAVRIKQRSVRRYGSILRRINLRNGGHAGIQRRYGRAMRSESIAVVSSNLRQIIDAGAVRAERLAVGCNGNILRAINLHDTGYRGSLITEASFMRSYSSPVPSYHTLQRAYRVALRRDSVRVRDQRFVITRQLLAVRQQLRAVQV